MGLAAAALVTAASSLGYLENVQAAGLDILLRLQPPRLPHDVAIVAIDETAFERFERRQPIPRDYLARIVNGVARSGADVVAIDVTLTSATTPEADGALAEAVLAFSDAGGSRVVLVGPLAPSEGPLSAARLAGRVLVGSARVPMDDDGVIRRISPSVGTGADASPALAVVAVARRGESAISRAFASAPPGAFWIINYVGPRRSFLTVPSDAVAALADPTMPIAEDNPLRGRIVFVGATFEEGRDFFSTPHGLMAGVEIHANAVHMLTTRRFIRPSDWLVSFAIAALAVVVVGVVLTIMRPLPGTVICAGGGLLVGVPASYLAFHSGGYWVDFALPVAATCLTGLAADALARRRVRDSFGRYLSRQLLAQVVTDSPSLRGEQREVSILFSDIRGFTALSETLPPDAVAERLNEYFAAMTEAIFAHCGMINDFIGDAVMAVFGAPVTDTEHALHAVQSAAAMQRALDELNLRWAKEGLPALRMGIGVHTGIVFAGNVGGSSRIKYTMIGDPVNVASRVEGLNKDLGTTILLTEQTLAVVADRVRVKDRGPVLVKGRLGHVHVHELLTVDTATRRAGP